MKALYIIAWAGLVLSIIVHVSSILGPKDVLSDIDEFVWLLHGGAILLGLPLILCLQKLTIGTQEKDCWRAALQHCPLWMRRVVGLFFFYEIINFILFITKRDEVTSGHDTPASIFKGFSGHWMIIYSIEVATFYSCLKQKLSNVSKSFLGNQVAPMDIEPRQQYNLKMSHTQTKRNKYSRAIAAFLVVGSVFLVLLWLAFKGHPWFLGCTLFSLFPFVVVHVIYAIYSSWKTNVYLRKNHFEIWEKGKSSSFADRLEYQKLIKELDDPFLNLSELKETRFSKICFWVWLILIGLVLIGLILFQSRI